MICDYIGPLKRVLANTSDRTGEKPSAFITPKGLCQYRVMPFGMRNSPVIFQRMINGCEAYIDDVVTLGRISLLNCRFSEDNLTINLSKSEFGHAEMTFLGHIMGNGQVKPTSAKIQAIVNHPTLRDKQKLRHFLGMAGYYRRFCHNFSLITAPLTNLLKKNQKYEWDPTYVPSCFSAGQVNAFITTHAIGSRFSETLLVDGGHE